MWENGVCGSMLCKIRCNPMHYLHGALPLPNVPVRVTRGAVIAHQYTYEPPRSRTSQYRRTFIFLSLSLGTILVPQYSMVWEDSRAGPMPCLVFDGVGGFKSRANWCPRIRWCGRIHEQGQLVPLYSMVWEDSRAGPIDAPVFDGVAWEDSRARPIPCPNIRWCGRIQELG